jgi:hypothetical protein
MYNEAELLVLKSILLCSYCGSKNVEITSQTTTLAAGGFSSEWNFNNKYNWQHTHDTNYVDLGCKCNSCGMEFSVQELQACVCGWRQDAGGHSDVATQMNNIPNDRYVRNLAHYYWVIDGKPNGEEYRHHPRWGRMKIKDIHWRRAIEKAEICWNHNAGGDW